MRDVIEMARRAGAVFPLDGSYHTFERREDLEAFAELVRADERKQIALDKKADNARELGLDYEPVPENFMDALKFDVAMRDAAPVQEPLMEPEGKCKECLTYNGHQDGCSHATTPAAQRQWVGLTDEEIERVWQCTQANDFHDCVQPFAQAIEAKLKERNA
jgi:hypothetical protein